MQPLRSVGRSNFDNGRHNLTTLIQKSTYINESCYIIYIYTYIHTLAKILVYCVHSIGLKSFNMCFAVLYIYIYVCVCIVIAMMRS